MASKWKVKFVDRGGAYSLEVCHPEWGKISTPPDLLEHLLSSKGQDEMRICLTAVKESQERRKLQRIAELEAEIAKLKAEGVSSNG